MIKKVLFILLIAGSAYATARGGHWVTPRTIGLNNTMGTGSHSIYGAAGNGSIMLSTTYYTVIDSIAAGETFYTMGWGEWYADTLLNDTGGFVAAYNVDTTALYLDGFVDQDIQVNVFFLGSTADTFFIVVEQALSYHPAASDSGKLHGSSEVFNRGFSATDTLFRNDYGDVAPPDTFYVPAKTDSADADRFYTDSFVLTAPILRLKIISRNAGASRQNREAIHFEIYCRHRNDYMSGSSGRLQQSLDETLKSPRGRAGLPR